MWGGAWTAMVFFGRVLVWVMGSGWLGGYDYREEDGMG